MSRLSWLASLILIVGCTSPADPETTYDSSDAESDGSTTDSTSTTTTTTGLPTTSTTFATSSSTEEPETDTETADTSPEACGNGVLDGDELCDDGNDLNTDDCLNDCTPASCGDGFVHEELEECDDQNMDPHDACLNDCTNNVCGDGIIHDGVEVCDDANSSNTDYCLNDCTVWSCGDGFVNSEAEACDDGVNSGLYGSCTSDCSATMPACGDGIIDPDWGENCDGDPGLDDVVCDPVLCQLDFSNVKQLFCRGYCTWDNTWGCGQGDADLFCRLLTKNKNSYATDFDVVPALEEPGFACADPNNNSIVDMQGIDPRVDIGPLPEYGVTLDPLYFQSGSIAETHGAASSDVITNPVCANP